MTDGAECVAATIYTRSWSGMYSPYASDGRLLVLVFEREDCKPCVPIPCNENELADLLRSMAPPTINIRSAPGENVEPLQALVESTRQPLQ